jgi:predicted signal transduction protein with EAL and GGDEF domain
MRKSGILMHITSLPNPYGIGTVGKCAYDFVDFLKEAGQNMRAKAILEDIIALAGRIGITSLTEGVETKEQYDGLLEMGCQMYQGYYFAKPMPVEEFDKLFALEQPSIPQKEQEQEENDE